ncbi:MAG: hypothetical protein ACREPR_16155 [Brasilonema sp.]
MSRVPQIGDLGRGFSQKLTLWVDTGDHTTLVLGIPNISFGSMGSRGLSGNFLKNALV